MTTTRTTSARLPYPGLRAFRRDESDIFFGRESLIDTMVDKLAQTRFLAVLGSSGSGKSSLVRTGLLDALELGLSPELGSQWVVVDTHPGSSPFENLARAMLGAIGGKVSDDSVRALVSYLRRGPRSLQQWYDDNRLAPKRLLVLVDQFEELFRYSDFSRGEEAEAFSTLLVESTQAAGTNILAIVTMRSEYLGACSLIPGLTECINEGLFLTPRMTRSQCLQAIEGPARVVGFRIDPALSNRILNDITAFAPWEEDPNADQLHRISQRADQLPLMQHVLNRLWQQAGAGATGAVTLTEAMYVQAGGLRNSLGAHGNEIMQALPAELGKTCERVFRGLVSGSGILAVRRPCTLDTLVALAGGDRSGVAKILDLFRSPSCNFVLPELTTPLTGATVVDISHESLIRQWPLLTDWAAREEVAGFQWQRLSDSARRNADGKTDFLNGRELAAYLGWWDEEAPNETWASRYGNAFDLTKAYLDTSNDLHVKEVAALALAAQKRTRRMVLASIAVMALLTITGVTIKFFNDRSTERESLRRELPRAAWKALTEDDTVRASRLALAGIALSNNIGETDFEAYRAPLAAAMLRAGPAQYAFTHESGALSVAISPDGRYLASGGNDNVAVLRRIDGTIIKTLTFNGSVAKVSFSQDGAQLCTASGDGTAALWDGRTGALRRLLKAETHGQREWTFLCGFSADGHKVMTASGNGAVRVWDTTDGQLVAEVRHLPYNENDSLQHAVLSPDGSRLVTTGYYGARLWNVETRQLMHAASNSTRTSYFVSFSREGSRFIVTGGMGAPTVVDSATGKSLFSLGGQNEYLQQATFTPDGLHILGAANSQVRIYNAADGKYLRSLSSASDINSISFSRDGTRMAVGGRVSTIWDARSFAWQETLSGQASDNSGVSEAVLSGDGMHFASASRDGSVRIWRLTGGSNVIKLDLPANTGDVLREHGGTDGLFTAVSGDARRISGRFTRVITGKNDTSFSKVYAVALWDMSGTRLGFEAAADGDLAMGNTYLSPDSRYFVVLRYKSDPDAPRARSDCSLDVFDAQTGRFLRRIDHVGPNATLTYIPRSPFVAVRTVTEPKGDDTAKATYGIDIWNLDSGKTAGHLPIPQDASASVLASSPTGSLAAVSITQKDRFETLLWDVNRGKVFGKPLAAKKGGVYAAAFSHDGRLLATGGEDKRITLWDVASGTQYGTPFDEQGGPIFTLAFAPDGKYLVSDSSDNPRIWLMKKHDFAYKLPNDFSEISADSSKIMTSDGVVLDDKANALAQFDDPAPTSAFTADGKGLVTIDGGIYVHRWSFAPLSRPLAPLTRDVCDHLLSGAGTSFTDSEIKDVPGLDNNHWQVKTNVCDAVLRSSALEDKESGWRGWLHKATAWLPEGMRPQ